MKRRNYTREILDETKAGGVPVNSLGIEERVVYAPRSKRDPQPWVGSGIGLRYSGRYVHVVPACGRRIPSAPGTSVFCGIPEGREHFECRVIPAVRYTIS